MKTLDSIQNIQKNKYLFTLDQIIKFVCEYYHLEEIQLHTKSRCRLYAKIRAVIAWLALEFKICSIAHVAVYFKREHSTVTRILNRIVSTPENDELKKLKEELKYTFTQA